MEKKYAIILFKGKEYLCGHEDGCHYDVSCPVRTFTEGEDDFKIQESGKNRSERTFRYHGKEFRLVTGFYPNGWPVLSLESPDNGELYTVLTVNLEDSPAFGIPDQAFIDINNNRKRWNPHKEQPCRRYGIQTQKRMGRIPDGQTEPG